MGRGKNLGHWGWGWSYGWFADAGQPCYLFRDLFTTADATPVASPRTSEPGPGALTFVQTDGEFSIDASDRLAWTAQTTPNWGDQTFYAKQVVPWWWGEAHYDRELGRTLKWRWLFYTDTEVWGGFQPDTTPLGRDGAEHSIYMSAGGAGLRTLSQAAHDQDLRDLAPLSQAWWQCAIVLGGHDSAGNPWYPGITDAPDDYYYGAHFFVRDENGDNQWQLIWYRWVGNVDTLYPAFSNYDSIAIMDWMVMPCDGYVKGGADWESEYPTLLAPTTCDYFTGTNGVALPAHTMSYGGLTWVVQGGVWTLATNKAVSTAVADSVAHVPTTKDDCWVEADAFNTADSESFGLVIRKSADTGGNRNEWRFFIATGVEGNDTFLVEVDNGVETTKDASDFDHDKGPNSLRVHMDAQQITCYVDYIEVLHYATADFNENATWHGLYADNTAGVTFDNFQVKPKGTAGEYDATLNSF